MKPWIKWTLTGVGVLVVVVAGAAAVGWNMAEHRMARKVDVPARAVAYVSDAQALARGRYLYESRGCAECHGVNGGGRSFVKDDKGLHLAGPNITQGGVTASYKPEDWDRIVRHGVKPNGTPAMVMPSEDFARLTDADLAAIVAHVRALPAQPPQAAIIQLPPPVRILYGFGAIPEAVTKIDHSLPPAEPVEAGVNLKHGAYVANMCIGCHGEHLSGGKIPGGPPDWPPSANITPGEGSAMSRYKNAPEFIAMLRSGKRPDGTPIRVMPFETLARLNEVDAQALHAYLQTVPARPAGGR
jgi:mono/diheme cytochrome c family protein